MFASRSAIESDNSPNEGSNSSSGTSLTPATLALADSRKDEREDARKGVVGREIGRRELEVERVMLLLPVACGVVEEDMFRLLEEKCFFKCCCCVRVRISKQLHKIGGARVQLKIPVTHRNWWHGGVLT